MSLSLVYHPDYVATLPEGHRFPMRKFRRLYELLLEAGVVDASHVHQPQPVSKDMLKLAHSPEYVDGICDLTLDPDSVRRIGLPLDISVVKRSRSAVGGTLLAARLALEYGAAFNTAGGSHHAFSDHGSGYCVFNDVAVATSVLTQSGEISRALIIDLDVHQGDGTAEILRDNADAFTFSMHCAENFPKEKQTSDLDIALAAGTADDEYLDILEAQLRRLLPQVVPDLVIYNAGVDPHFNDRLGKLCLTDAGLEARERLVLQACVGAGVPIAGVVGGGYDSDPEVVARRHAVLPTVARSMFA